MNRYLALTILMLFLNIVPAPVSHALERDKGANKDGESPRPATIYFQRGQPACVTFSPDGKVLAYSLHYERQERGRSAKTEDVPNVVFLEESHTKQVRSALGKMHWAEREGKVDLFAKYAALLRAPQDERRGEEKKSADNRTDEHIITLSRDTTTGFDDFAQILRVTLSPDGKWLAFTAISTDQASLKPPDYSTRVVLADATTGKLACRITRDDNARLGQILFSPDSQYLLITGLNQPACLFDLQKKEFVIEYESSKNSASLTFSPDGKSLVGFNCSRSNKWPLMCWDARTGKLLYCQENTFGRPTSLSFSADGRYLATAHQVELNPTRAKTERARYKETVYLWQMADAKHLGKLGEEIEWIESAPPPANKLQQQAGVVGSGFRIRKTSEDTFIALPSLLPSVLTKAGGDTWRFLPTSELTELKRCLRSVRPRSQLFGIMFTPDERILVGVEYPTASSKVPIVVVLRSSSAPQQELTPPNSELEKLFEELATPDMSRAQQAGSRLARFPSETLQLFKDRLRPVPSYDPELIARLITLLNHDEFDIRDKAEKELLARGRESIPAIRKALAAGPPPESRRRMAHILEVLTRDGFPPPVALQHLWAIEVLKQIGTPEACNQLRGSDKTSGNLNNTAVFGVLSEPLKKLADGEPKSGITQAARDALKELEAGKK